MTIIDNKYYEKAIEYYSIALKKIDKSNFLIPTILYRRGTCYERINDWKKAEEDLEKSLEIKPKRGLIFDRNNKILAENRETYFIKLKKDDNDFAFFNIPPTK